MIRNHGLKNMTAAVYAALAVSALILAMVCVFPQRLIRDAENEILPLISIAKKDALSGNFASAREKIEKIIDSIGNRQAGLMLFYDHEDVFDLINKADTALDMSYASDVGLLIAALGDLENDLENLLYANRVCIANVI